jgi:hypothetical protein
VPIPGVIYTRQPIATEALYTLAAAIEGNAWGHAPGILQWLMIVLGTAVFAEAMRRFAIPSSWRPWVVLLVLTQPIMFVLQLDRMTDWTGQQVIVLEKQGDWLKVAPVGGGQALEGWVWEALVQPFP